MPSIVFDDQKRKAYQEPQTTKKELLAPPASTSGQANGIADWTTPRATPGATNLLSHNSTWSFNGIGGDATRAKTPGAPMKREASTPALDQGARKRQEHFGGTSDPHGKKARADDDVPGRKSQSVNSDERYGRLTGVIDLTAGGSDGEDDELGIIERQYIPRVRDRSGTSRPPKRTSPSPPRTFTRGLSPIAAHSRKPPIVHRSKPPVKPASRRQASATASPAPSQSLSVFPRRQASAAPNRAARPATPLAKAVPGSTNNLPARNASSSTLDDSSSTLPRPKATAPFLQDESSDGDQTPTPLSARQIARESLSRQINRPKADTSKRKSLDRFKEESKAMRERSQKKTLAAPTSLDSITENDAEPQTSEDSGAQPFLGFPHPRMMH